MNEDLKLMNELEAVRKMVEKTGTQFVFQGEDVFASRDLLQSLQGHFEHERWFFLDNGPNNDQPGVYVIEENGEINPDRKYAPVDSEGAIEASSRIFGGDFRSLRPSSIHFDFDVD